MAESEMCERREGVWYCVSFEEYRITQFKNAVPVEDYYEL